MRDCLMQENQAKSVALQTKYMYFTHIEHATINQRILAFKNYLILEYLTHSQT